MEFSIDPSPSEQVVFSHYDPVTFPKFRIVFERTGKNDEIQVLAQPPEEADTAIVMENRSDKEVTALKYNWVLIGGDGDVKMQTVSLDSYVTNFYRALLRPKERMLITRVGTVDEAVIDHVQGGGGAISAGISFRDHHADVASLRFQVDMLLFADGEITGPDTGKFALEMRQREIAAEYVARHIRLAESEGRDVTPVLSAVEEIAMRTDPLLKWVRQYAQQYLRAMHHGTENMHEAILSQLENHPKLPKFYRP